MKFKSLRFLFIAAVVALVSVTAVLADDGELLRKSMSKAPGQPDTKPVSEAEHAFIDVMNFYVPAQASNGAPAPIVYNDDLGNLVDERDAAKPLVGVYIYGPVEPVEGVGFVGHGKRDAFAAISLDDGNTWKRTNLSESADLTSCDRSSESGCSVVRKDIKLFKDSKGAYPGDVVNVFQATAGNNALVVWPSRYCQGGSPNYSLDTSNPEKLAAIAGHMGIELGEIPVVPGSPFASPDDLYLIDMFGVGGSQGSVDYSDDKFEQNQVVGEVPFNCLWAARGTLVQGDDPRTTDETEQSFMRWFKAERLTSGRRDVNRVEASCVEGAGCAITWQEDPDGLRGGQGEGPGEGWSGAVANSQTDVWYSYIGWEHFNLVENPDTGVDIISLDDYELSYTGYTQKPQVGIPFAMPMRVTDNAKCNVTNPQPYCNGSAISADHEDVLNPLDYGMVDMCEYTVQIPTGPDDSPADICVTEHGLPLVGNIAATRPRLGLFGYDSDGADGTDSAFVVFEAEEDKGLGAFGFTADGTACDPDTVEGCVAFDEGKNLWYYSFNMELTGDDFGNFATKGNPDSLLASLGGHGNMLNQPEVDWETGEFYPVRNTAQMWDFTGADGDFNYDIYNTEIARRGSLLAQGIGKAEASSSRLLAMPSWKQGIMNQGGPADVMVRRIVLPEGWTEHSGTNPYAFGNMECAVKLYDGVNANGDPLNPYYPGGLCQDPATNLSGYIPDSCIDSADPANTDCPGVTFGASTYGIGDTEPILQGLVQGEGNTTKVLTWHQCPFDGDEFDCTVDRPVGAPDEASTLKDQSWYNPLDVAKGHRGFLDGDFVMMLYAWSPNWRLNAKGNDRYELYVRRSFDGGETWTALPASFTASDGLSYVGDGTVTCETYRSEQTQVAGELIEPVVCYEYAAGAPEQARNVTQLKSMRFTTLDPRYAPTSASITDASFPFEEAFDEITVDWTEEDTRDPSRYFIVYETGDNTTTALGEPEPDDLFYSRAINFGDDYVVWAEDGDSLDNDAGLDNCYPNAEYETMPAQPAEQVGSGFCNEFDQLDQGSPGLQASEASMEANPGGEFMYGVWAQWLHETKNKKTELVESDAMARRVWYIDDYISDYNAWKVGGGSIK